MKKRAAIKHPSSEEMTHDPLDSGSGEDDVDFPERERSRFQTEKEYQTYLGSLPTVELQFDPRLKPVKTSIRLSQRTIDGYDYLAKQHGLPSGEVLMKIVLDAYLVERLPEDF